jgi:hypothetical protein
MNAPDWQSVMARIVAKVEVADDGCWLWTGSLDVSGYGRMAFRGRNCKVARVVWSASHEIEWPENKAALHSCDNRRCVNPDHIRPGTIAENNQEAWDRGALRLRRQEVKGFCRNGHALTPDNLVTYPSIAHRSARCRECQRLSSARQNAKRKERAA